MVFIYCLSSAFIMQMHYFEKIFLPIKQDRNVCKFFFLLQQIVLKIFY